MHLFIHTFTFWQHKVHSTHWSHKGLSRFCFAFVFVFIFLVANLAYLATQIYSHTVLYPNFSLFSFFSGQRRWKCYVRHLSHRPKRYTSLNTTQNYYFTGLFCRRFIRDIEPCIVTTQVYFNKDTRVKRKNIARLICHKGLSSTQDYCLLTVIQVFTKWFFLISKLKKVFTKR